MQSRPQREEIYHYINDMRGDLRRTEERLEAAINKLTDQIRIQNGRVAKLEQWRWTQVGAGAALMWIIQQFWLK